MLWLGGKGLNLSGDFKKDTRIIEEKLRIDKSFDLLYKDLKFKNFYGRYYFVDGFVKDGVIEKMTEYILQNGKNDMSAQEFCDEFITYMEADLISDIDKIITEIFSGNLILIIEGMATAINIGARTYFVRGIEEPQNDQVLRGSRDGFNESIITNTTLLRRRIRDTNLTMEYHQIGTKTKSDIVICYMENMVNKDILKKLRHRLINSQVSAVTLGHESIAELIKKKSFLNPFPKIRYTERPDMAAANVLEGKIILLIDNSPCAMILPTFFFDFSEDTNDYYFSPLLGTYLRIVRLLVFAATIFFIPLWMLIIKYPDILPTELSFLIPQKLGLPVIIQVLIVEFVIDGLKLASLNTPSSLSHSFSVVAALILGEMAVTVKWFSPHVLLYCGFSAIANFTQPSYELGYAFKFYRIILSVLVALFGVYGFLGGVVLMVLNISLTKTVTGESYIFPLIPFDKKAFFQIIRRQKIQKSKYN